jgi:hypothetical protein
MSAITRVRSNAARFRKRLGSVTYHPFPTVGHAVTATSNRACVRQVLLSAWFDHREIHTYVFLGMIVDYTMSIGIVRCIRTDTCSTTVVMIKRMLRMNKPLCID